MKMFYSMVLIVTTVFLSSCEQREKMSSVDIDQKNQTAKLMEEAHRQTGMPNIINFQQKKMMKMIYELTDQENLICYAYLKSDYTGKLIFIGKTIGYGVPFSAQYSNPFYVADDPNGDYSAGSIQIPQPEPNGLFMPVSSSATWLMMVDPKTDKPRPVYIEPEIVVSPFPLH